MGGLNMPEFKTTLIQSFLSLGIDYTNIINNISGRSGLYKYCDELKTIINQPNQPNQQTIVPVLVQPVLKIQKPYIHPQPTKHNLPDGVYTGELINGKPNGIGKYEYKNGNIYEGTFSNGLYIGKGKIIYENGDVYEGTFKDRKMDGKGQMKFSNGDVYIGNFSNDMKNDNNGTMILYDETTMVGKWVDDNLIDEECINISSNFNNEYLYKDGKHPDNKTKTGYYCQYNNNLCLTELKNILYNSGIKSIDNVHVYNMSKINICKFLNDDHEQYEILLNEVPDDKKIPDNYCNNDTSLLGDDLNDINIDRIIRDDKNNCFTIEEITELKKNEKDLSEIKNPYTTIPFNETFMNQYKQKTSNYIGNRHIDHDETLTWSNLENRFKKYYEYIGDELPQTKIRPYKELVYAHNYIVNNKVNDAHHIIYEFIHEYDNSVSEDKKKLYYLSQYIDNNLSTFQREAIILTLIEELRYIHTNNLII